MSHSDSDLELSPDVTKINHSPPTDEVPESGLEHLTLETDNSPPAEEDTGDQLELPHIETSQALSTGEDALPPLLRLPAELRNRIWMLCLVDDNPIRIGAAWLRVKGCRVKTCSNSRTYREDHAQGDSEAHDNGAKDRGGNNNAIRVLQTNRQIHDEGSSIFYGMNTFTLFSDTAWPFLEGLGKYLQHIRSIAIDADTVESLRVVLCHWPPKLERVDIHVRRSLVNGRVDDCATEIARDVLRFMKEATRRMHLRPQSMIKWFKPVQWPHCEVSSVHESSSLTRTGDELDAAFQEKLRELLASNHDPVQSS